MTIARKISRSLAGAVLLAALVTLVLVAVVQAMGWYRFVPVLSGSMSPYIDTGDVAVLEPLSAEDLEVGDVIAFNAPVGDRQLMLHRVSEVVSPAPDLQIRTRGDANSSNDPWVASIADGSLWHATGEIPLLGRPVVAANEIGAMGLLLMAGVVLLAVAIVRGLWTPVEAGPSEADPHDHEGQSAESVVAIAVVTAVIVAGVGLLVARPARAEFTASASDEQRVTFVSATPSSPVDAPTDLEARLVCDVLGTPTGVQLQWVDPTTAFERITIERSDTPLLGAPEPFVQIGTVPPSVAVFLDDFATLDPPPSNPFDLRYRVRAEAGSGVVSEYSNVATTTLCTLSL